MSHRNIVPVMPGFWSDPTVCRTPDGYALAHSSFEYFPGAPVHRSTDLVEWEQVGNVVTRPEQADLTTGGASSGIYGSTLRHHDGKFWFITTNMVEIGSGQHLFTADSLEGPWSDPVRIPVVGIDPDIAWDEDGTCLVTWCGFPDGIQQVTVNPATGEVLDGPRPLWNGTGMRNPEGPHLYRVGGWWYLLIAEGGTDRGHSVSVARGRSPLGPFEGNPANPILTHRSTDHPVQSTGHADLVEGPGGQWFAVYHGTRPHGGFPEFHVLGRETFLSPVEWVDGWPVFVDPAEDYPARDHGVDDDFTGALHARWVSPSGDRRGVATGADGLTLDAGAGARPVFMRLMDHSWSATAEIEGEGRLMVWLDDAHWYAVEAGPESVSTVAQIGPVRQVLGSCARTTPSVTLRLSAAIPALVGGWPASQPDVITLSALTDDGWEELAEIDGRYVSTEVAGGFTGRMVGVAAVAGTARCRRFTYSSEGAQA
ncbi:glycoside hydrolase family 43 protein [Tessaracoccus sp. G1721]